MDSENNDEDKLPSKDTRWDRIRKRHMNSINAKTETVKKFFAMDYIGKEQLKLLSEDISKKKLLDPVLVMNLRHEVIRRKIKRKEDIGNGRKEIALQNTKTHNKLVEEHYIANELKKFKTTVEKTRHLDNLRPKLSLNLNNGAIFESLEKCNQHTIDFYNTIENALQQSSSNLPEMEDLSEKLNGVKIQENKEDILAEKIVRFEDSVEIINYSPRDEVTAMCSSNTSSDVDSVISDMVEDCVQEVQIEVEIEMVGKSFESLKKPLDEAQQKTIDFIENSPISHKTPESIKIGVFSDEPLQIKKILPVCSNCTDSENIVDIEESTTSKSSDTVSKEQVAIISELFNSKAHLNEKILRKYFLRWTHATTISKIEKLNLSNKNDRFQKINSFLDVLRREKRQAPKDKAIPKVYTKENSIKLAKKYQNKIKVQQDIIDLQKIKLERQERLIMELKLNKLLDEHKQSREEIKQELKTVIKTGDVKHRSKAKCLQLVGNLRDQEDEDEFSRLQGRAIIMPKFLVNMHERAMERNIKHEQAKQRRLQLEAEREAVKIAAEEAKRLEDEEAKRKRIELLKEKRRLEKLAKAEKERARLLAIENNKKCQEYRRRSLLRNIGMEGFKRLIKRKRKFQKKAETYRKLVLKQKTFRVWIAYVRSVWEHKYQNADNMYKKIVKKLGFKGWLAYHQQLRSKYLVAVDWYELKITEALFQQWLGLMKLHKLIEETKSVQALSHYNWNLRWKVLDHWRRLPTVLKIEKETEERRQRWRMKIWELLPDYKPNIEG